MAMSKSYSYWHQRAREGIVMLKSYADIVEEQLHDGITTLKGNHDKTWQR